MSDSLIVHNSFLRKHSEKLPLFFIVFLYVLSLFFTRLYSVSIDNFLISCVLHGVYDSDNYCSYLHPILSGIIRFLNSFFPSADFFCLLQILFTFFAFVWFQFLLLQAVHDTHARMVFSAFSFLGIVALNIAHSNFTVAAAFFSFIGFLSLLLYMNRQIGKAGLVVGLFYSVAGCIWRMESFLILVPFYLLSVVFSFILSNRNRKRILFCLAAVVALFLCLFLTKNMKDTSLLYATSKVYDDARSSLQDFPVLSYEEAQTQLSADGISRNDYLAAIDTLLLDLPNEDSAFLLRISNAACEMFSFHFLDVIREFLYDTDISSLLNLLVLIVFLFFTVFSLFRKNCPLLIRIELLCAIAGAAVILVFFLFWGRIQDRVIYAVLFGTFLICIPLVFPLSVGLFGRSCSTFTKVMLSILLIVFFAIAVFCFVQNVTFPQNVFDVTFKPDYGPYEVLLDNGNTYIWDTYYMKNFIFETLIPQGVLYEEEFIDNNIPDGEWTYGQPYYNRYLDRIGMTDPIDKLLHSGHCYYISRQYRKDILLEYIHEHYDANATVEQCGDIILDDARSLSIFCFTPGN